MAPWVSAAFTSPTAIIWLLAVMALSLFGLRVFASATFTAIGFLRMAAGYIAAAAAMMLVGVIVERLEGVNWLEVSLAMTFASWLALAVVIAPGAFIAFRFTRRWWSAIASVSLVVPILIFLLDLWDVGTPAVERLMAYPIGEMKNVAGLVLFFALSGFSFAVGARLKSK